MAFGKILQSAKTYSYFTAVLNTRVNSIYSLQLGHSGTLFQELIKSEWFHYNVKNREIKTYYFNHNNASYDKKLFHESFTTTLESLKKIPFGVAEYYLKELQHEDELISKNECFKIDSNSILSCNVFLPSSSAMQYFLYWQRQRKLWWKKIASVPQRFHLSEINVDSQNRSTVNICAEYPWGNEILETIFLSPLESELTQISSSKIPHSMQICNKMSLDVATVGLYCDAFNEETSEKIILKLNSKLAPYKCIFAVQVDDVSQAEDLVQLAFYLNKQLKNTKILTLLLPDCVTLPIQKQFQRNDEWGIPYTVVIYLNSLKTGVIGLRNRDTTIEEDVHISELKDYMGQLSSNYR